MAGCDSGCVFGLRTLGEGARIWRFKAPDSVGRRHENRAGFLGWMMLNFHIWKMLELTNLLSLSKRILGLFCAECSCLENGKINRIFELRGWGIHGWKVLQTDRILGAWHRNFRHGERLNSGRFCRLQVRFQSTKFGLWQAADAGSQPRKAALPKGWSVGQIVSCFYCVCRCRQAPLCGKQGCRKVGGETCRIFKIFQSV